METLWRIFNRLLIVIVGATFGLGTGVLGVYFAMVALFGELDRDSWGAAPVWILAMIVGGVVATIFAAIATFSWTLQVEFRALNVFEWLGLILASIAAYAIFQLLPVRIHLPGRLIIMATIWPVCIFVGCLSMNLLTRSRVNVDN